MEKDIVQLIAAVICRIRPEAEQALRANESLSELLDSFDIVMLVEELEAEFGLKIEGDAIIPENFDSLEALTELIKGYKK